MAKQKPRASLAERRRHGPASGRGPLAVLASFAVLLVVSWPVAAIAKRDHGGGQDRGGSGGERHSGKGQASGKEKRGGGGHESGGNSGRHAERQSRRGGRRGRGANHGDGGNKGPDKGGKPDKSNKRDRHQGGGNRKRDTQPSRVTAGSSPATASAPGIPVPAPTPQVIAPSVPAPTSSPPAPAFPTPAPGALPAPSADGSPVPSPDVLPGPLSDATPEGGSPTGAAPLTQQPPGTSSAGTHLGAPSVSGAAAASLDGITGNRAGAGKDERGGGAAGSGGLEGERSGVTGAAQRGAAKVVKVIPAYMWAATSTLFVLTLLLAAATWLVAGRGRRPVRQSAGSVADTAPMPMPVPMPVPIPRSRARASAPARAAPLAQEEPRLFEGEILLHAGPFGDTDALADFERRLARLPLVHDVRVGHFQGDRVLINLRLAGPTDLAHELRHEFGPAVGVASSGSSELVADLSPRGA